MSGGGRWARYYRETGAGPPRRALAFALDRFDAGPPPPLRRAVDLGCGSGRDTVAILARGWRVLAIDAEPSAIAMLRDRTRETPGAARALEARVARFEEARWPPCALVNAGFSLPLVPPAAFAALWPRLVGSLVPGGRVSCQLFGVRDGWADDPGLTFHSAAGIDRLLAPLCVEMREEEETRSVTPRDKEKRWHLHHIVARKEDRIPAWRGRDRYAGRSAGQDRAGAPAGDKPAESRRFDVSFRDVLSRSW